MDKDRVEGSIEQAKGKVKEVAGKVTGDTKNVGAHHQSEESRPRVDYFLFKTRPFQLSCISGSEAAVLSAPDLESLGRCHPSVPDSRKRRRRGERIGAF